MRGEELPGAIHARLHLVEHEQAAVSLAERLCFGEILGRRNPDACLSLNRLDDEGRDLPGGESLLERPEIAERDGVRVGKQGAEAVAPEGVAHQGQGAAGQAVERAVGVEQPGAVGVRAGELDGCLDAFAAGTAEEGLL